MADPAHVLHFFTGDILWYRPSTGVLFTSPTRPGPDPDWIRWPWGCVGGGGVILLDAVEVP